MFIHTHPYLQAYICTYTQENLNVIYITASKFKRYDDMPIFELRDIVRVDSGAIFRALVYALFRNRAIHSSRKTREIISSIAHLSTIARSS